MTARRATVMAGLALAGSLAACTVGDAGSAAQPGGAYGGGGPTPLAAPDASAPRLLPPVTPPYDVASTAASLAEWPHIVPGVETRAVTSFDRTGGNDDGFAGTWSQIGPTDARGEHAILDVGGPGVLRTLWLTDTVDGKSPLGLGTIRFYFDEETEPRLAIDADALFAGTSQPFATPLVANDLVSTGGFASWVPLPFRKHLRITTPQRAGFYQAHFDLVPRDWDLASYSAAGPDASGPLAARFAETGPSALTLESVPLDVSREGAGEIDVFRFEPDGSPADDAIRAARLQAWFDDAGDDAPQIDVPLTTFFGSGLGEASVRSIVWTMQPGLWESRMPMPFWKRFRLRVSGLSGTLGIHVAEGRFSPAEAGYLEAIFHDENPTTAGRDFVYADLTGAGKLVATVLTVEPPSPTLKQWWEGDLRSRADSLGSPAIHGTGHEDDHLGGWSNEFLSGPFTLPMQGCPKTELLDLEGQYNANATMYRIWPGIGFLGALRHTTEHGTGNGRQARYSATTFVYRQPRSRLVRTDGFDVDATDAVRHGYSAAYEAGVVESVFEGEDGASLTRTTHTYAGEVSFTLAIDPDNAGVKLRRLYDAAGSSDETPEEAQVFVEGFDLGVLYVAETNPSRRWAERDLFVPPQITIGRTSLAVRLVPVTRFGAARFEAWTVKP